MRTSGLLRGARRWLRVAAVSLALALCGCATQLPGADFPKPPSYALSQPAGTLLGNQYYNHGGAQAADRSGFKVLPRGLDGLAMRAQLIDVAEKTIDVQYYIFDEDQTGHLLVDGLLRAADRGVRVRVLIDDGDAAGRDALIGSLDAHPNIEVRVFNPFSYRGSLKILRGLEFAFNAARLDYRMHNKLFVVDNAAALAGGRNVANEYFQVSPQYQLGDYDVFAAGPIVARLSRTFDEFWNSRLAIPVEALHGPTPETEFQAYRDRIRQDVAKMEATRSDVLGRVRSGEPLHALLSGATPLTWAHAEVVYDPPEKLPPVNGNSIGKLMPPNIAKAAAGVRGELLMITPYFVPGDEGMALFQLLRDRGVRIGVVTNSLESTNEAIAHSGYVHYRAALLQEGVALHELRAHPDGPPAPGSLRSQNPAPFGLHGKAFVFDRRRVYLGSMNFDQRSMHINTELGLLIDSAELARQVAGEFEVMADRANSYTLALEPSPGGAPDHIVWRTSRQGQPVELAEEPSSSLWRRLNAGLLSLLSLDGEL